jgi:hypothetical protein
VFTHTSRLVTVCVLRVYSLVYYCSCKYDCIHCALQVLAGLSSHCT